MHRKHLLQLSLYLALWWWVTKEVIAQIRESREVLLAPALEVFTGNGTMEEIYLVTVIVIAFGLLCAVIAVNVMLVLHKFTFKLLVKVFTIWFVFAAGVSTVSLSHYLSEQPQETVIRADEEARPKQVRVLVEDRQLTVFWQTMMPTRGQLAFTTNTRIQEQVLLSNQGEAITDHEVSIQLLPNETEIQLAIISDGIEYRQDGKRLRVRL